MKKEIKLKYPIEFEGEKIEKLVMRPPKVKDVKNISKHFKEAEEQEVALFAKLTDKPIELIEELYMADYAQLQEVYSSFLQ